MAILDTNFLIALESRDAQALAWLEANRSEEHHVPDVVAVEYLTGHSNPEEAFDALESAFTIAYGTSDWILAATGFRKRLRARRMRFRSPDFWIASWAVYFETTVVTRNRAHFEELGVNVADW